MNINEYETTCIFQPEITEEALARITTRLEGVIEHFEGQKLAFEDLGLRRLAYNIQRFTRGRYLYWQYLAEAPCISELERIIRIESDIIRFLTIRMDEHVDVKDYQPLLQEQQEPEVSTDTESASSDVSTDSAHGDSE